MKSPRTSLLLIAAACAGCSPTKPPASWKIEGRTMGTTFCVTLADPDGRRGGAAPDLAPVAAEIEAALEDVARQMSTYRPDSEISRFNASPSTDPTPVSEGFAKVVSRALEIYRLSGGRYDVTVAPLVQLWGFGPAVPRESPPADEEIQAALAAVGSDKLEARLDPPALRKLDPAVRIDLNSIAPGYAVDLLCEILDRRGFDGYLVDIGGEFRARGRGPNGAPWRVGVERPERGAAPGATVQEVVELRDEALATSGDYRAYFEFGGVQYSHTIDPTTGRPVVHNLASVTIVAPDCMTADALATAVLALGPEEGARLVERTPGVRALFVLRLRGGEEFETRAVHGPVDESAAHGRSRRISDPPQHRAATSIRGGETLSGRSRRFRFSTGP
jgi:thiamine biosynthesis lipoprotein